MFDTGSESHFIIDRANGGIVSANVRFADLLGRSVNDLLHSTFEQVAFEPSRVTCDGRYDYVALKRFDGLPVFVTLYVAHIADVEPGRNVTAYSARDTAEHPWVERDLLVRHSALVAAHIDLEAAYSELRDTQSDLATSKHNIAVLAYRVGVTELVGSVAHHLNNPLGALHSTIRSVSKHVSELPPEHRGDLDRRIRRITNIAGQIESNVNAIVTAGRASKRTSLPPELAAAIEGGNVEDDGAGKGEP